MDAASQCNTATLQLFSISKKHVKTCLIIIHELKEKFDIMENNFVLKTLRALHHICLALAIYKMQVPLYLTGSEETIQ